MVLWHVSYNCSERKLGEIKRVASFWRSCLVAPINVMREIMYTLKSLRFTIQYGLYQGAYGMDMLAKCNRRSNAHAGATEWAQSA